MNHIIKKRSYVNDIISTDWVYSMIRSGAIYLILHNIRSAYNVGTIFRTADAAGVSKIYVCGYTPAPSDPKVSKTALGAEKFVAWERKKQTWRLVEELKLKGVRVAALEQTAASRDYRLFKPKYPLAVVVGHEKQGVSRSLLERMDSVWHIPMRGQKESLNVAVAVGIFLYKIL